MSSSGTALAFASAKGFAGGAGISGRMSFTFKGIEGRRGRAVEEPRGVREPASAGWEPRARLSFEGSKVGWRWRRRRRGKGFGSRIGRRWRRCGNLGQGLPATFKGIEGRSGRRRGRVGCRGIRLSVVFEGDGSARAAEAEVAFKRIESFGSRFGGGGGGGGATGGRVALRFQTDRRSGGRWRRRRSKGFGSRIWRRRSAGTAGAKVALRGPVDRSSLRTHGGGSKSLVRWPVVRLSSTSSDLG